MQEQGIAHARVLLLDLTVRYACNIFHAPVAGPIPGACSG